ncbi:hypothetical protein ACKUSY_09720 [Myroides odoratus]
MKISIQFFLVVGLFFLGACSKSDDNKDENFDFVFSQEFIPLKSFNELRAGSYLYAGFKAEGRKMSMLIEGSKSCTAYNDLFFIKDDEDSISTIQYNLHSAGQFGCMRYSTLLFLENKMFKEGILFTTIKDPYGKRVFKGLLEIGFQGDYLRIEDKISDYVRKDPDEKVYLYFKNSAN